VSDEPKTTKVYLMVPVCVDIHPGDECEPDEYDIRGEAKELLWQCMINSADTTDKGGRGLVFRWGRRRIVMDAPKFLPDDIENVLWQESISHLPLHQKLREAVIREGKRPAKERLKDMIDRGVINEKGEVLLGCHGPWEDRDYDE
jgi:hypothetical protein